MGRDQLARVARAMAVGIGACQAVGTIVYAVVVAVSTRHTSGWTMPGSRSAAAVSLVIEYLLYAAAICVVVFGLARSRGWAATPFLLIQALLVIAVGGTLVQSGNASYVPTGVAIMVTSTLAGMGAVVAEVARRRTIQGDS